MILNAKYILICKRYLYFTTEHTFLKKELLFLILSKHSEQVNISIFILQNNKALTFLSSNRLLSKDRMLLIKENMGSKSSDVPGRQNTKLIKVAKILDGNVLVIELFENLNQLLFAI